MKKAIATTALIRSSLFPSPAPPAHHAEVPATVEVSTAELPSYAALVGQLLRVHNSIEMTLPPVYPIAGYFVAIRMKHDGFTFRIVNRRGRLVIIASR